MTARACKLLSLKVYNVQPKNNPIVCLGFVSATPVRLVHSLKLVSLLLSEVAFGMPKLVPVR